MNLHLQQAIATAKGVAQTCSAAGLASGRVRCHAAAGLSSLRGRCACTVGIAIRAPGNVYCLGVNLACDTTGHEVAVVEN